MILGVAIHVKVTIWSQLRNVYDNILWHCQ